MYSQFDIVWPDTPTCSNLNSPRGVDPLSYGLATLVMGEDVFRELPRPHSLLSPIATSNSCEHCGCNCSSRTSASRSESGDLKKPRRGNSYAQYMRRFSVGNGPPGLVREYAITSEMGKILGTLMALAVARMVNLESFVWDMPTGVLTDVWVALASLADRPGHECRLERVWVRWHDNSLNPLWRSDNPYTSPPLSQRKSAYVEYPTLSILPPLKSLSVLDIDEKSYLEELGTLVKRSWDRLRELRIGISPRISRARWLEPLGSSSDDAAANQSDSSWPRVGGALGVLLNETDESMLPLRPKQEEPSHDTQSASNNHGPAAEGKSPEQSSLPAHVTEQSDVSNAIGPSSTETKGKNDHTVNMTSVRSPPKPQKNPSCTRSSSTKCKQQKLRLETLQLERVQLSIPVMFHVFDWTQLTSLTILRCGNHEKLWRTLRRKYAPSVPERSSAPKKSTGTDNSNVQYPLRLRTIHTDCVSPSFFHFIKEATAPNSLESIYLQNQNLDTPVQIESIYRSVLWRNRMTLVNIFIDSSARAETGRQLSTYSWRKWMLPRDILSFITSGRMPKIRELGMAIHSSDWVSYPLFNILSASRLSKY